MSGDIFWKERSIITLTSTGASLTNNSGAAAGTELDVRTAGNAEGDSAAIFRLACQWGTVTGIAAGSLIADLYLVPKVDGTALPDLDLTTGASYIPYIYRVAGFVAPKIPTVSTTMTFDSNSLDQLPILPLLYTAHLINRSGQSMSANWSLKAVTARRQYS